MRQSVLFRTIDGQYIAIDLFIHPERFETRLECSFKPMEIDQTLWTVSGQAECFSQPLSYRSFGIGLCEAAQLYVAEIEEAGDSPDDVAAKVLLYCSKAATMLRSVTKRTNFSDLIAARLEQGMPGNLHTTYALALIAEGKLSAARVAAETSLAWYGGSPAFHRVGKAFEHKLIKWLDARSST